MSTTKKALALLDAVNKVPHKDRAGLAVAIKTLGLTGSELNELRRARIEECLTEMDALCNEVVQLRCALDTHEVTDPTVSADYPDSTKIAS